MIEIEENDVTIQSLSVSHRTTLLAGKGTVKTNYSVVNPSGKKRDSTKRKNTVDYLADTFDEKFLSY